MAKLGPVSVNVQVLEPNLMMQQETELKIIGGALFNLWNAVRYSVVIDALRKQNSVGAVNRDIALALGAMQRLTGKTLSELGDWR